MYQLFLIFILCSSQLLGQINRKEVELIQSYKSNLVQKDLEGTIQSLKALIALKNGNTQYQISLGYIYQLQGKNELSNAHLGKGRAFVLQQLETKALNPKQTIDHIVALCFAGFEKDCLKVYNQSASLLQSDAYYSDYDFVAIQQLANQQRQILQSYFAPSANKKR